MTPNAGDNRRHPSGTLEGDETMENNEGSAVDGAGGVWVDRPVRPWRRWVFAPLAGMAVWFLGCMVADFVWRFEARAWTMLWGGVVFLASLETGRKVAA